MTPTLHVTIGPPGCGKSALADRYRAADPTRRARLSRDGLREAIGCGGDRDSNPPKVEHIITLAQDAAVTAWLRAGLDAVVDETCQLQSVMDGWAALAEAAGAGLVVWDFRGVPLDLCIARDAERGRSGGRLVGEAAIRLVAERCAVVRVPPRARVVQPE